MSNKDYIHKRFFWGVHQGCREYQQTHGTSPRIAVTFHDKTRI